MEIPRFVYLLDDIIINNEVVKKFEVGIIISEDNNLYLINFAVNNRMININKNLVCEFDPLKTGDSFSKKVCNVCHRYLDVEMFKKNQNGKNNRTIRRPSCVDCRKVIDGILLKKSEYIKWNGVKPYMTIFECPICHKTTIPGLTSKVVLDHDHKTGLARGWICDSCNTGIGRFKDNIELLKNAINYLTP